MKHQWRHCEARQKFNTARYQFLLVRRNTDFCILWCLHWLSRAIGRLVMAEIASKAKQFVFGFWYFRGPCGVKPKSNL